MSVRTPSRVSSAHRVPAQVRRAELRAEHAGELSRTLAAEDVEQLEVSAATGASSSVVQRWADRSQPQTPSLADVVLLGASYPGVALRLLRWAAERLGAIVAPRLPVDGKLEHLQHAAVMARESAEAVAAVVEAHADGVVTDDELARLHVEVREAEEAFAALREWVDAERERRGLTRPVHLRAVGGGR